MMKKGELWPFIKTSLEIGAINKRRHMIRRHTF